MVNIIHSNFIYNLVWSLCEIKGKGCLISPNLIKIKIDKNLRWNIGLYKNGTRLDRTNSVQSGPIKFVYIYIQ